MAKFKTKSKWKSIIAAVLVIGALIASCALIAGIAKKDTETIGASGFDLGALDYETGKYKKSETSLVNEEMFRCDGLNIEPDFDSTLTYQVFFYNMDGNFIGYTKEYSDGDIFANSTPQNAWYARVMITPDPVDEDGKEIKDFKIKWYEKYGIANDLTITVNKEQNDELHNIYAIAPEYKLSGDYDVSKTISLLAKYSGSFVIDNVVVNDLASPETLNVVENEDFHCLFVDISEISKLYIENRDEIVVHLYSYNEESGEIQKTHHYTVSSGEKGLNEVDFAFSDFAVLSLKGEPGLDISVYDYLPKTIGQIN